MNDKLRQITRRATALGARLYSIPATAPETPELVNCMSELCEMVEALAYRIGQAQDAADDAARRQCAAANGMNPDC